MARTNPAKFTLPLITPRSDRILDYGERLSPKHIYTKKKKTDSVYLTTPSSVSFMFLHLFELKQCCSRLLIVNSARASRAEIKLTGLTRYGKKKQKKTAHRYRELLTVCVRE